MSALTATVVIATIGMTVLFIALVLITTTFRQALSRVADAHDAQMHNDAQLVRNLLDRLAAIRWEDYVTMQTLQEEPEEGGFLTPEEQKSEAQTEVRVQEPDRWGPLSRKEQKTQLSDTEQALLDEDFPEAKP